MFGYLIDNHVCIYFGMGIAFVVIKLKYLGVVRMHHNKDTQSKIIDIAASVWTFWVLFSCVLKLFFKVSLIMFKPKSLQYRHGSNLSVGNIIVHGGLK